MADSMLERCVDLVGRCRRLGADAAEVYGVERDSSYVEVREGKLDTAGGSTNLGVAVRAWIDGRVGFAYSSDHSPGGLDRLAERVVELARHATADPLQVAPATGPVTVADLGICDGGVREISREQKVELAARMEAASRAADPRVTGTARARYGDSHVTHTIATSGGCEVSFDATQCTLSMAAIARHNGLANQGYAMEMGRALADLDVEAAGRRAAWRACASLGGEPVPTKRASVVMAPEVVSELLNGVLQALSGDAVRKGRSFLAGAVGETIAASRVTLTDDGRLHGALGTTPVDGEGMQTQHTPLIERGTLVGLLHASDSAIRAGVASTGNAGRSSFRATPDVMASNVLLEAGSRSTEELIRSLDDGFYVVTSRNVGGINPVSGDYSVGAAGVWVERGEMVMPVTGVTIAAPIRELLGNVIEASNDPRWVGYTAAMLAPSLRVDGMMIGGR